MLDAFLFMPLIQVRSTDHLQSMHLLHLLGSYRTLTQLSNVVIFSMFYPKGAAFFHFTNLLMVGKFCVGMLRCSSELGIEKIYDWMCGSFSCCFHVLHHMVVRSIC